MKADPSLFGLVNGHAVARRFDTEAMRDTLGVPRVAFDAPATTGSTAERMDATGGNVGPFPSKSDNHIPPVDPSVRPADAARLTGQNAAVWGWLQAGERLTARSVWDRGVQRLAARVLDIERATGVRILRDVGAAGTVVYWIDAKKGESQ